MEWWRSEIFLKFSNPAPPVECFLTIAVSVARFREPQTQWVLRFAGFQLDRQRAELGGLDRTIVEAGLPEG
jgi:hypothetical protein